LPETLLNSSLFAQPVSAKRRMGFNFSAFSTLPTFLQGIAVFPANNQVPGYSLERQQPTGDSNQVHLVKGEKA
ncbi:MAG: hypothetical protein M1379_02275, partial [Firmicutes bacterium]|nr:hypothetical protein [Bacillota bacterium]